MSGETKVHDFQERLAFSQQARHESFWQAIYDKAFPDMELSVPCIGKCQGQYLGIDRIIYLSSGKMLTVDEKVRDQEWPDILLEYLSNDKTGAKGWMDKPLLIDYMAYAFLKSRRCYLFDWQLLRRTWLNFKGDWLERYTHIPAKNHGYTTWSVAVPIPILLKSVKNASIIQLK